MAKPEPLPYDPEMAGYAALCGGWVRDAAAWVWENTDTADMRVDPAVLKELHGIISNLDANRLRYLLVAALVNLAADLEMMLDPEPDAA